MPAYAQTWNDERDTSRAVRRQQKTNDRQWTPEQDAYLGTDTDAEVGRALGKSAKAVEHRRRRLGIRRSSKAGRRLNRAGYIMILLDHGDQMIEMARSGRYVPEHRFVMALHLGRPLTRDEFVHHRNGIKTDNHIENLELWTRSHPDGQRVEDVLQWCFDFVERYANEQPFLVENPV